MLTRSITQVDGRIIGLSYDLGVGGEIRVRSTTARDVTRVYNVQIAQSLRLPLFQFLALFYNCPT